MVEINTSDRERSTDEVSEKKNKRTNLIKRTKLSDLDDKWVNRTDEFFLNNYGEIEVNRINSKGPTTLFLTPLKLRTNVEYAFQFSCDVWIEDFFALTRSDAFMMFLILSDNLIIQNESQKMLGSKIDKQIFVSANMENLTSGKWKHIELNVKTKTEGALLDVALHISGDGHLKYKNLTLVAINPKEEINNWVVL